MSSAERDTEIGKAQILFKDEFSKINNSDIKLGSKSRTPSFYYWTTEALAEFLFFPDYYNYKKTIYPDFLSLERSF